MDLVSDSEFKALIPPLTKEEYSGLKESLIIEGCRDALILWDDIIVDGHNRYQICTEHNIPFNTTQIDLKDKDEIKGWIIKNQFARRNLTSYQRSVLALKLEDIFKMKAKEQQGSRTDLLENSPKSNPIDTRKEIAQIAGVSDNTIAKVKKIEEKATDKVKRDLAIGKRSINSALLEVKKQEHKEELKVKEWPEGKYRVIYADPPWDYGENHPQQYGNASKHYANKSIAELCKMSVSDLAEENSVLFLWVTSPFLELCFQVIKAWGFKYKTSFVWDKEKHNMGHYNSVRHELLLICTKGSCLPDNPKLYDSVVTIPRKEHSEKPEYFRQMIDDLYLYGNKIELFAEEKIEGWDTWGNEI